MEQCIPLITHTRTVQWNYRKLITIFCECKHSEMEFLMKTHGGQHCDGMLTLLVLIVWCMRRTGLPSVKADEVLKWPPLMFNIFEVFQYHGITWQNWLLSRDPGIYLFLIERNYCQKFIWAYHFCLQQILIYIRKNFWAISQLRICRPPPSPQFWSLTFYRWYRTTHSL